MKKIFIIFPIFGALVYAEKKGNVQNNEIRDFKDNDANELLNWKAPLELQKDYPYYLSGFDEDGLPIWIAEMGKWDTRKSVESGPQRERDFRKYILQFLKRCQESTKMKSTKEEPITEFNIIVDMEGYGVRQTGSPETIGIALWMAKQFEQAFRDNMRLGYIINGNYIFTTIWCLMKPILGANVFKIDVFGTNRDRWVPVLLKTFPRDQLPKWYGGTKDHKPVKVYG